jgi:hypothetical protein
VKRSFLVLAVLALVDCGAPPWQLGKPLDGRPSIPPSPAIVTPSQATADAKQARSSGRRVLEITALQQLEVAEKLTDPKRARLAELLAARAAEFHALGRAIPESADLEAAARLDAKRGEQLMPARAVAAAAAGDAWKAIGAREEARAAFARAAALGGVRPGEVGFMPRRKSPALVPAENHPPTSTTTCWKAHRCRRGCCRWSPRSRGCSIIERGRCSGRTLCWPRIRRRPTSWSWSRRSSAAPAASAARNAC